MGKGGKEDRGRLGIESSRNAELKKSNLERSRKAVTRS